MSSSSCSCSYSSSSSSSSSSSGNNHNNNNTLQQVKRWQISSSFLVLCMLVTILLFYSSLFSSSSNSSVVLGFCSTVGGSSSSKYISKQQEQELSSLLSIQPMYMMIRSSSTPPTLKQQLSGHCRVLHQFLSTTTTTFIPRGRRQQRRSMTLSSSSSSSTATTTTINDEEKEEEVVVLQPPPLSSTAKRIFYIRHGEVINPGSSTNRSVLYGNMDVPLSTFGQQEAIIAAQYLSQFTLLSYIYSSNLSRAIYGAEQILYYQQQKRVQNQTTTTPTTTPTTIVPSNVIQVSDFTEINRGDWNNKTIDEIGKDIIQQYNECIDDSIKPSNGGESYRELYERVIRARNDIVLTQLDFGQCAAVVSHLQVTRCIVANALCHQYSIPNEIYKIPISTASITCIDYDYSNESNNNDDDNENIPKQIVHFQSYKPPNRIDLRKSIDGVVV